MTLSTSTRPALAAEEQLQRMEAAAKERGASENFVLAEAVWTNPDPLFPDRWTRNIGRALYVERSIYGDILYRRFMDCGWFVAPEWATAHLTRDEALLMLAAFYAEKEVSA